MLRVSEIKNAYFFVIATFACCLPVCSFSSETDTQKPKLSASKPAELLGAEKAVRTQNLSQAFLRYKKLAQQGNAEAQYQLANLYSSGTGTPKNAELARSWLKKAASQNHPASLYNLALYYEKQISAKSLALIQKSAAFEYPPAIRYLESVGERISTEDSLQTTDIDSLWFGATRKNAIDELQQLHENGYAIDQPDTSGQTALFVAIESGSYDVVDWLLAKKADPNHRDNFGNTALFLAARNGDTKALEKLFRAGADAKQTLKNGDNLWHYSIRLGKTGLENILLKNRVSLNHINKDGWSPLDIAQYTKNAATIRLLKKANARRGNSWIYQQEINERFSIGSSSQTKNNAFNNINQAAKVIHSGDIDLAMKMIQKQPGLVKEGLADGSSLLTIAIKDENLAMVDMLIQHNAKVKTSNKKKLKPLHIAARIGNNEIISRIVEAGGDPLEKDKESLDAIDWAIFHKQEETALFLLDTVKNRNNVPYDHYILDSVKNDLTAVVKMLTPRSSKIINDDDGRTPLWYASYNKNADMIIILSQYGQASATSDKQGQTPLFVAAEKNCFECVKIMLSENNINQATLTGNTPLIAATVNGNGKIVELILANQPDIEARNNQGNTALMVATENQSMPIITLLVDAGAKISRKNKLGISALDIAKRKNNEIYQYLKSKSVLSIF